MDAREAAVTRFRDTCQREELIVAAFLGGSLAAGIADEASDLDIYAVTRAADYELLFRRRSTFVDSWAQPLLLLETPNFEGLGSTCCTSCLKTASMGNWHSVMRTTSA
jgi:nucleotidyltransferase-like protein